MVTTARTLLLTSCLALVTIAGCGGGAEGPASPSPTGGEGAIIAGKVNGSSAPAALSVAVVGTNLTAAVESSGSFQLANVPAGNVQLQFRDGTVNATARISNVVTGQFIEIQVEVGGGSARIVTEVRSAKVALCHKEGNGSYHSIEVSVNAEPDHRGHGDGKVGDPVPGAPLMKFDENCRVVGPAVEIRKSTNGDDASNAPGPSIRVGSTVTWQYVVTNTGTVGLANVTVVDDRGVAVNCNGQTTLTPGASMTCTGSGAATLGQYRNVGTVTASWTLNGTTGTVTDTDPSHYLGIALDEEEKEGPKVQLCHRTGNGSYHLIEVSVSAEPAHRAHGDGKIGDPVAGQAGKTFGAGCTVR